jgi:DHA1 family tetracycline resistance protein-like MFS transporter
MTSHRPTATIFFILMAVLIDMIAVGVIMPVLPALVGSFSDSKANNAFWYGVVACSFGAANFIGAPILGALSDRFGRRPILLTSFSVMAGCLLLTGPSDRWRWCSPWRACSSRRWPSWPTASPGRPG